MELGNHRAKYEIINILTIIERQKHPQFLIIIKDLLLKDKTNDENVIFLTRVEETKF